MQSPKQRNPELAVPPPAIGCSVNQAHFIRSLSLTRCDVSPEEHMVEAGSQCLQRQILLDYDWIGTGPVDRLMLVLLSEVGFPAMD